MMHIPFARWLADKHAEAESIALSRMSPAERHKALRDRDGAKMAARRAFSQQRREALREVAT